MPGTVTEVARIQWKSWSSDRIVYYGCSMKRAEFMPKAGLLSEWVPSSASSLSTLKPSSSDFVIVVNGAKYRWTAGEDLPKVCRHSPDA